MIPRGFAQWAEAARRWRQQVKASGLSFDGRRRFWQLFTGIRGHASRTTSPGSRLSTALLAETADRSARRRAGSVTLVGAGPGDPELLTLARGARAAIRRRHPVRRSGVARDVLDFARREAKKMLVGKTGYGPSCKQDEINALMVGARQGRPPRGAAQGRRPDDLRPRRRGDRGLPQGRHRGRGGARHHRGARRGERGSACR